MRPIDNITTTAQSISIHVTNDRLDDMKEKTTTAQSISIHDLNSRIEFKGPDDELARLARTFNEMIERLQSSFEKQISPVTKKNPDIIARMPNFKQVMRPDYLNTPNQKRAGNKPRGWVGKKGGS